MKHLSLTSLPLAALVTASSLCGLAPSRAARIGINFQDDWDTGGGAPVTETSFGIPASDWFNMPRVKNSIGAPFSTSSPITLPDGATLLVEWSAINTYSQYADIPTSAGADPGGDQVAYGYLDDSGTGYRVRLSGLRNAAADFKISLIASTDNGSGFSDGQVVSNTSTDALVYGETLSTLGGGIFALSAESPLLSAATENNAVSISGLPRNGTQRSTLAGLILDYTPATANVPVIETQPTAPTGTLFIGGSFTLTATASGSAPLAYQWRRGTTPLGGQTNPTLNLSGVTAADSGDYNVVVTNAAGNATSNSVTVAVSSLTQPLFTETPLSQTFYVGYPATFTSLATGGELSYSWKKGATPIPGATGPTLTLPALSAADAATYTVTATNLVGSASTSAVLAVNTPAPGTYEAAQAAQKPLLWYRYSETAVPQVNTGTAANLGSTGAAATATAKRYAAFQQAGALAGDTANKAVGLKTSNQFIDIPYNAGLNSPSFTAELWVKAPPTNNGRIDPLINRGPAAGDGFLFFGWNGVTKWQFRTYNGTLRNQINSDVDIVPGAWAHLVGTYDAATGTQRFYVNGVQQGTGLAAANGYTPNSTLPMRLAGFPNDNGDVGGGNFAGGAIDEVAIYPSALSSAEVLAHFQNATNPARPTPYATLVQTSSPSGYWRLDDPVGLTPPLPRNSGTAGAAFNGLYGGDLLPSATGPQPPDDPGFAATNSAVAAAANGYNAVPALNITTNTLTVTTWIKRAEKFTTDDLSWPAWLGAGGFHLDGSAGRPYGELRYHWDGSQWGWGSGLQVPAEVWTFCAMVLEPTRATFYLGDGDSLKKSSVNATHTPHLLNQALAFGGNQTGRTSRNFMGQIDESAFYDRVLSESEIAALFLNGSGAPFGLDITPGGVIDDTKPNGAALNALNAGSTWLASSTDNVPTTRQGVQQFSSETGDQIKIAPAAAFDSPTGTIMFWMKADLPSGPGSEASILLDRRTTAGTVIALADSGNIFVQCNPGGANTFTDSTYVADGNWHHIAVFYNQDAAGSIGVYVDGIAGLENTNAAAWTWPAAQPIELGKSHDPYWKRFGGQLDDLRFYSQILSSAEIAQVASSGAVVVPTALQARYDFATPGSGFTLSWPYGILESSTLQPGAPWLPVPDAVSPQPLIPSGPARFYRAKLP